MTYDRDTTPSGNPRLRSRRYGFGSVVVKRGRWVLSINGAYTYTGLPALPETEARAVAELEARCFQIEQVRNGVQDQSVAPSLYAATDEWYAEMIEGSTDNGASYRSLVRNAIAAFSPKGADILLTDHQRLRRRFSALKAQKQYSPNTLRRYLQVWSSFFTWCQEHGWVARNPIDLLAVPDEAPPDTRGYTRGELRRIIASAYTVGAVKQHNPHLLRLTRLSASASVDAQTWLRELARLHDEEPVRIFVWMLLTGMRAGEVCAMRWSDIAGDWLTVHGKGYRGKPKPRLFPLALPNGVTTRPAVARWMQRIGRTLAAQRTLHDDDRMLAFPRRGDYVWRWRSTNEFREIWTNAAEEAGIDLDGRSLHHLRKTSIQMMEYDLGLPSAYITEIAGHTEDIRRKHYRGQPRPHQALSLFERAIGAGR